MLSCFLVLSDVSSRPLGSLAPARSLVMDMCSNGMERLSFLCLLRCYWSPPAPASCACTVVCVEHPTARPGWAQRG